VGRTKPTLLLPSEKLHFIQLSEAEQSRGQFTLDTCVADFSFLLSDLGFDILSNRVANMPFPSEIKPGVVTGDNLMKLLAYAKETGFGTSSSAFTAFKQVVLEH
jgi:hypothetical protein